ncbi:hypothetical protein H9Q69_013712 [Fusarium xylarioides]|uniref:Uncharacterized protein n=1 Tax=Fusarium xylarioides TaxID=221167 RepID=A0A9P7L9R9_9HYPO|nr:hypothetical protein H9Q70_010171 [Fusarium xylarioides]KAG5765945.1 hypothetical protein H9Q72_005972 [Fusarium xylarioides]KAG5780080.1 hypothetical protein H9Q73_006268 [Fusarium xylarioides]KAG5787216.1 hypothetical protein H9Q69_013712 [Fusarium xylarioides]KAG5801899.1 hypothetical protein H9Q71_013515 [Fusarium xylarioides]
MAQIQSLSSNTECPQELEEWFVIIKEKMPPQEAMVLYVSSFIFKACQVQARIFKILSSRDNDAARIAFYDIVASIRDARQELKAFAESPRTAIGLFDTYMGNLYAELGSKCFGYITSGPRHESWAGDVTQDVLRCCEARVAASDNKFHASNISRTEEDCSQDSGVSRTRYWT